MVVGGGQAGVTSLPSIEKVSRQNQKEAKLAWDSCTVRLFSDLLDACARNGSRKLFFEYWLRGICGGIGHVQLFLPTGGRGHKSLTFKTLKLKFIQTFFQPVSLSNAGKNQRNIELPTNKIFPCISTQLLIGPGKEVDSERGRHTEEKERFCGLRQHLNLKLIAGVYLFRTRRHFIKTTPKTDIIGRTCRHGDKAFWLLSTYRRQARRVSNHRPSLSKSNRLSPFTANGRHLLSIFIKVVKQFHHDWCSNN